MFPYISSTHHKNPQHVKIVQIHINQKLLNTQHRYKKQQENQIFIRIYFIIAKHLRLIQ